MQVSPSPESDYVVFLGNSWARHFTVTVPLMQKYKWVGQPDTMLGGGRVGGE